MTDRLSIEHDDLEHALACIESSLGAAEVHGQLCGVLCASTTGETAWLHEVLGNAREDDPSFEQCREMLLACREQTERELASEGFRLHLLLPVDGDSLHRRARALGAWCSGFLYGLGMGGADVGQALSEEAREVLEDFSEFTRMQADPGGGETEERAFMEVLEYVRMGVLLVVAQASP